VCKGAVDAKIVIRGEAVYFDKFCPAHGRQECLVSSSAEWYLDCLTFLASHQPPKRVMKEVTEGCPFDCGACSQHQQKVYLPVIPITSGCNLDCPICYTINKNDHAYTMSKESFQQILDHLVEDHDELDIINFTGGEPTLHPELPEFLAMCREAGIRRLTISTNGLKLLDESYVRKLAAFDARIVLSLDTFDPAVDKIMLGANTVPAKLTVLDLLEKHDVTTTILPAVAMGLNDADVPKLFDMMLRRPHICSLELHTMTFTGQGGAGFNRSARITIPDLHRRLEESTQGRVTWRDFVPSPLAHPHCYSICYLLMVADAPGGYVPFARLMPRAKLFELLADSLYIEPREKLEEVFREIIDSLWANPDGVPESDAVLKALKDLIAAMFPSDRHVPLDERRKIAERSVKAIYIHSHMDEENFDVSRIMKCCVGVPSPDGTNIPTCSYNVLYREKDSRFADGAMLARISAAKQKGENVGTTGHQPDVH
jgi:uncharacterized radical SAM superfamily Fe-S cluster-containing enzyme